jgi:hypothetical protein
MRYVQQLVVFLSVMLCSLCLKPKTHCIACLLLLIPTQVRMEARTPEAMIMELETLTQAISGLSSTLRSRINLETESVRSVSPAPIPDGLRRLSPGERTLEKTKSEQRRLQEERVVFRLKELSSISARERTSPQSQPPSRQSLSHTQGDGSSAAVQLGSSPGETKSSRNDMHESSQVEEGRISSQGGSQVLKDLPTVAKRNITSQRSRDRRDGQAMKQPSELTAKRTKDRTKDKQYARESGNWEDLINLGRTSRKPPPSTPKPETENSRAPFLKRDISVLKEGFEAYKTLMAMYHERAEYEEFYHEALHDNDSEKAERFRLGTKNAMS